MDWIIITYRDGVTFAALLNVYGRLVTNELSHIARNGRFMNDPLNHMPV